MKMTGEYRVPAPQQKVWDGLNDPEILQQSVPGCESIERTGENEFNGTVRAKVGPVSAKFRGKVTLTDLDPPNSCKIVGEGTGGAAGFAKGSAVVRLAPDGDATMLSYEVDANVGGKLAQIGQRFIDSTAKKMADDFFAKFGEVVGNPDVHPQPALVAANEDAATLQAPETTSTGVPHPEPSQLVVPPVGGMAVAGPIIAVERDIDPSAARHDPERDVPLISDLPAGAGVSNPPATAPEDTGLAVETAGESRGFSPAIWVPVLLIILVAIVLFFLSR